MKNFLLITLTSLFTFVHAAQAAEATWAGKTAAVVLTYDDALNEHLDIALPELDRYGFKGTFYLTANSPAFSERLDTWRAVAANGHELGNHTLFHPCDGSLPGRDWVLPERDLSKWSVNQFIANVQIENVLLEAVDGKKVRTFAYTCGDQSASGQSFLPDIKKLFPAARGVQDGLEHHTGMNLFDIKAVSGMGQTGAELIGVVDKAIAEQALVVFLFHGVGGGHGLNVSKEAHAELLAYLAKRSPQVWVTTMLALVQSQTP